MFVGKTNVSLFDFNDSEGLNDEAGAQVVEARTPAPPPEGIFQGRYRGV
ncbi:MAG: hypothetical protein ABIF01_01330 [Candidatus Micrarchaeota archaeon]